VNSIGLIEVGRSIVECAISDKYSCVVDCLKIGSIGKKDERRSSLTIVAHDVTLLSINGDGRNLKKRGLAWRKNVNFSKSLN
jgi:hypothetical protein